MQTRLTAELNLLWAMLILEELARLGVKHICMAPGSRSTPLVLAAMGQQKLIKHNHFDERGLGFMALGLAKASQSPVAIITTSGTAVANLYPAVIEAWLTKVPLIILSGDRPPELFNCGANQAIIQSGIFSGYAVSAGLPTPSLDFLPQAILSRIDELVSGQHQPVHINCMFREPLYPSALNHNFDVLYAQFSSYLEPLTTWFSMDKPYYRFSSNKSVHFPNEPEVVDFIKGKGIIVAGTLSPDENPNALIELSKRLGWPLLTDAQCQLRQNTNVIGHIDQLLHSQVNLQFLKQAEKVLVFGGRLLSKRLISFLNQHSWKEYWQVLPYQERLDPTHSLKRIWLSDISSFVKAISAEGYHANWANQLIEENRKLEHLFISKIDQGDFGEAQVIRQICSNVLTKQLFIGNSLAVRLFDMFAPIINDRDDFPVTYTNRGASGIDGLLATACGVAANEAKVTTLVLGDLSQLHDLNSLAIARSLNSTLVIVILNNDGGNIFNLLPVPNESIRNDYYRLAHGLNFQYAAEMFNLPYSMVKDSDDFNLAYEKAISHNGASVIEVKVSSFQASDQIAAIANMIKDD